MIRKVAVIRKLKVFQSLEPADRRLLVEALLLPGFIWGSFRIFGVARTQSLLRYWARGSQVNPVADHTETIRRAHRAQLFIRRNTSVSGRCLIRSLTLWAMLLRRGVPTDLRVGFRRRDGAIQGHAWLEYAAVPINENIEEARSYVPYDKPVTFDLWRQVRHDIPGRE